MKKTIRILSTIFTLLLATACQDAPVTPLPEALEFHGPNYTFNVSNISIVQDYKSSKRPPNVEQLGDITPSDAVRKWAGLRLTAAGHDNTMEVVISDASIVRKDLPKQKTGVEGMFTTEQTEQYDGKLLVEIKIYNPRSTLPVAHVTATAASSRTLPQNAAPIDRERTCHQITVDMMKAIESQMDTNIHQFLGTYLM